MCQKKLQVNIELVPKLSGIEKKIDGNHFAPEIESLLNWKHMRLTDFWFYIPTWDDWRLIIEYLQLKVPIYYTDKFDCEDFADWWRIKVAEVFGINTMATVYGKTYKNDVLMGHHGWNIFPTYEGRWYQMEPQNGVIMELTNPTYRPEDIVIG